MKRLLPVALVAVLGLAVALGWTSTGFSARGSAKNAKTFLSTSGAVTVPAGDTAEITVPDWGGTPQNPLLVLYDSDGNALASSKPDIQPGHVATLTFTPSKDTVIYGQMTMAGLQCDEKPALEVLDVDNKPLAVLDSWDETTTK